MASYAIGRYRIDIYFVALRPKLLSIIVSRYSHAPSWGIAVLVEEVGEEAALHLLVGHRLAAGDIGIASLLVLQAVEAGHQARALDSHFSSVASRYMRIQAEEGQWFLPCGERRCCR